MSETAVTLTHDDLPVADPAAADPGVSDAPPAFGHLPIPQRRGHRSQQRHTLRRHSPSPRDPRRRELRRRGRPGAGTTTRARPHRRRATPTLGWRLLVATLGAMLLVLVSGMALGIVTVSPSGLSLKFDHDAADPSLTTGADGVHPGGEPRNVSLTVRNTVASAFEITGVHAELGGLPDSCPASGWRVEPPELLPTVPARSEVTVPLPVTLTPDAPDTCQGMTVRFPVVLEGLRHPLQQATSQVPAAGPTPAAAASSATVTAKVTTKPVATAATSGLRPEHLESMAVVTAARLGSPGATLSVHEGHVGVLPSPAPGGPAPTAYDVEVEGGSQQRTAACTGVAGLCIDRESPPAAARQYVVTARLGSHWQRRSAALRAWTPPPAPVLRFEDGGSALALTGRGGVSAYEVAIYADGAVAPFHTTRVPAGDSLQEEIDLPRLDAGDHRFVAVARFHGWRAPSGTVHTTVSPGGASAPQPPEEPAPITSDPAHPPLTTSGAPVPMLPTAAVPTTRQTKATRTTTTRTTTVRAPHPAGPPQETLPDVTTPRAPSTTAHEESIPVQPVPPMAPLGPGRYVTSIPVPTLPA